MKTILVVTKDIITGEAVTSPQMAKNEAEAKRSWGVSIANLAKNNIKNTPVEDYQLFKVGEMDTETLQITPCVEFLANGPDFIGRE